MSRSTPRNTLSILSRIDAMSKGFQKDFTPANSFLVDGTSLTQPVIVSRLSGYEKTIEAADGAKAAWQAAVAAKREATAAADALLRELTAVVRSTLGKGNPQLPDFGIALPKARQKPDAETTAVAVGKRRDTRGVRGTKGKQQALAITTAGKPGVALVGPDGKIVPGLLRGPIPPGQGEPVEVSGALPAPASGSGNTPAK